jgi:hypothetical protein
LIALLEFFLIFFDRFQAVGSNAKVVYVNDDDGDNAILITDENGVVSAGAHVPHFLECFFDVEVPYSTTLLGAVNRFDQTEYHTFGNVEPGRQFHVDFLLEDSVEIGGLDIYLVDF